MLATGTLGVLFPTARGLFPTKWSTKISRPQSNHHCLRKAKQQHLRFYVMTAWVLIFDRKQALNFSKVARSCS